MTRRETCNCRLALVSIETFIFNQIKVVTSKKV